MMEHFKLEDGVVISVGVVWPRRRGAALEMSIEKWQFIVDALAAGRPIVYDGGTSTCALCAMYIGPNCRGCPVHKKSGSTGCRSTPYDCWMGGIEGAKEELEFLKLLRTETVKRRLANEQ